VFQIGEASVCSIGEVRAGDHGGEKRAPCIVAMGGGPHDGMLAGSCLPVAWGQS
jgi:hypothetical protein